MDDILNNIKFCCDWMMPIIGDAGCKGFSILIRKFSFLHPEENENIDSYRFMIQFRSHELDVYEVHSPERQVYEGHAYIAEMALLYCPHCGAKLETVIENNLEQFIKLAEEHKHLVLD